MYCSTCGARVPDGRHHCDTCGASLVPRARSLPAGSGPLHERGAWSGAVEPVGACPRCGYQGEGVGYFSRGSHVAALAGLTLFTMGVMGVGGLVYYLARRDHRICPRCGTGWGRWGERAVVRASAPAAPAPPPAGRETLMNGWAVALFVLAALLAVIGIVATEIGPLVAAGAAAAGGLVLHRSAERSRERRRAALIAALQPSVLRLAAERGGRLTVSEVAAGLGWPLPRAEKVLQSLDDDLRVSSEVTDEGVIVYEFRELIRSGDRLLPGDERL